MDDIDEFFSTKPREQVGRDTLARYRAQIRAASLAALEILEGGETDRVYCDYHDDFVVKKVINGSSKYHFFQVKTREKSSKNWKLNEIFGLKTQKKGKLTQSLEDVKISFAGKLLQHTVTFQDACEKVTFMTNAHLDDAVEKISDSITGKDISDKNVKYLSGIFNECFNSPTSAPLTEIDILSKLSKLSFEVDVPYIKEKNNNFETEARAKIYHYSEIDLSHIETRQMLIGLLELVSNKTSGKIAELDEKTINKAASIDINDLLDLLSISRDAYKALLKNSEGNVIKSASVIQRTLSASGANNEEIEYASRCKTDWDVWLRDNRNKLSDFDLISLTSTIDALLNNVIAKNRSFKIGDLRPLLGKLKDELESSDLLFDITPHLLLGGFISALVRCKS